MLVIELTSCIYNLGASWRVYFEETTTVLFFKDMKEKKFRQNFLQYNQFLEDARDGNLPNYAFIGKLLGSFSSPF